jgi:hypothetical protein
MLTSVDAQVDKLGSFLDAAKDGLLYGLRLACQRDHAPIVVGIGMDIQYADTCNSAGGCHDLFDNVQTPSF